MTQKWQNALRALLTACVLLCAGCANQADPPSIESTVYYTIHFAPGNNGTGSMADQYITMDALGTVAVAANTFSAQSGYTFYRWYSSTGQYVNAGNKATQTLFGTDYEVTLYAQWAATAVVQNKDGSYTVNDSNIAATLAALAGTTETVTLVADSSVDNNRLYTIERALKANTSIPVALDLSKATSVTSIGGSAFYGCTGLTSVTIPNSVTSIGDYAFRFCDSLTSVTIGGGVTSMGNWAFAECDSLTSVTISNGVTSIGDSAFAECRNLTSVTIPDSVTSIEVYAFGNCSKLTSVTIPDSVTSIGGYAFVGCNGLTSVTIGNGVTSMGNWAFAYCTGLTSVVIPDSVTSIGKYAFYKCGSLTSVVIPDSVTSIGESAFSWCERLTSVTISSGVTSIGSEAFRWCNGLTSVTIGNGVTSIGNYAFGDCSKLTSVTFADTESVWYYTENSDYTGGTEIGAMSATDTAANATLLRRTYYNKYLYNSKYSAQ